MRLQSIQKSYDFIMSLGSRCEVANLLIRHNLRAFSGPLDWLLCESTSDVCRLFENKFQGFMELENMTPIGQDIACYHLHDTLYNIGSYHDFPLDADPATTYPLFKEKLNRRINRVLSLSTADTKKSSLFIRRVHSLNLFDCIRLRDALRSISSGPVNLLIVSIPPVINPGDSLEIDWGLDGICCVSCGSGDIDRWNTILKGITIKA